MEQECAEAQRKKLEFDGTFGSFSFHISPDGASAPLRLCALLFYLPFQTVSKIALTV